MYVNRLDSLDQLGIKLRNTHRLSGHDRRKILEFCPDSSHMLIALTGGNGTLTTIHGEQSFTDGSVYVCAPGENLSFLSNKGEDAELFLFQFDIKEDVNDSTEVKFGIMPMEYVNLLRLNKDRVTEQVLF